MDLKSNLGQIELNLIKTQMGLFPKFLCFFIFQN
jgi:hypothetical protein